MVCLLRRQVDGSSMALLGSAPDDDMRLIAEMTISRLQVPAPGGAGAPAAAAAAPPQPGAAHRQHKCVDDLLPPPPLLLYL